MLRSSFAVTAMAFVLLSADLAQAAVIYGGGVYSQNFDSGLPLNAANNNNIQTTATAYPSGWQDDTTTVNASRVSLLGWYLFHNGGPQAEGGTNGSQRLRFGAGNGNVGSFYFFSTPNSTGPEKALGSLASNTFGNANDPHNRQMNIGLRLTNNTGNVLTQFTIKYDGEQWRNAGGNTTLFPGGAPPEKLDFQYSLDPAASIDSMGYTNVNSIDFIAPIATATTGALDGNAAANRVAGLTETVTGLSWLPGTDLWLRWHDGNNVGDDDGLAIDNVVFSARRPTVPEPTTVVLAALAALSLVGLRSTRR